MIKKLQLLLLSSDVDVRITAGEAIALILEFAYDYDEVPDFIFLFLRFPGCAQNLGVCINLYFPGV